MNTSTLAGKIEVMQAALEGKRIQYRPAHLRNQPDNPGWHTCTPGWNWAMYEFRVEPEPREYWLIIDPRGEALRGFSSVKAANYVRNSMSPQSAVIKVVEQV